MRTQMLAVGGHLQQGRHLQSAGELGVRDVVRPGAQSRRPVDPKKEIRLAAPPGMLKGGLVDDRRAGSHGPFGVGRGLRRRRLVDAHHRYAVRQLHEVPGLVLHALAEQQLQRFVRPDERRCRRSGRHRDVQCGRVRATEECRQVGRAGRENSGVDLNGSPSAATADVQVGPGNRHLPMLQPGQGDITWANPPAGAVGRKGAFLGAVSFRMCGQRLMPTSRQWFSAPREPRTRPTAAGESCSRRRLSRTER